jgi:hypothetical protein
MAFKRGAHVCGLYSSTAELARQVRDFVSEGLRSGQRCWYVGGGHEMDMVRRALGEIGIDAAAESARGALSLIPGHCVYVVGGRFDPEATLDIFNDAIEQAYTDGFTGFRAAAEMSWALDGEGGSDHVVEYEVLLKSLFANCRAIGLSLYDRKRIRHAVLNGARWFDDPNATRMKAVHDADVLARLATLDSRPQPLAEPHRRVQMF